MFGIRTLWQEARATRLKEEFLDMTRRANSLTEETAEQFGRTLDYAFKYWIAHHGPVKECSVEFRKSAAKELKSQAKQRYTTDLGASYGLARLPRTLRRRTCRVAMPASSMI